MGKQEVDMPKLALGVGVQGNRYKLAGWITIDAKQLRNQHVDYVQVVPPLPEEVMEMVDVFDVVEGMHFWEHLYIWQAKQLAKEIHQILKPGGKLILELPNLAKVFEYQAGVKDIPKIPSRPPMYEPDPRFGLWAIYGAQDDPKWTGNIFQAHKWGYTPETITEQLKAAGFSRVDIKRATTRLPDVRDMRVEAYK
jgi:SAM-dependent methyltransferase